MAASTSVCSMVQRRGKVVHFQTYGRRDLEAGTPVEPETIFRIYSMTKPIVSVGLMTLYEEGRFQLDDPVAQYIPQFRERTFVISVDGAIVTHEGFGNILMDIAVLRSLNIRVVLVHGASAQIKALAKERHLKPSDLDGAGITDAETLQLALTAANRLTHEIL